MFTKACRSQCNSIAKAIVIIISSLSSIWYCKSAIRVPSQPGNQGETWKMTSPFSSQGKVREFEKSPSNQGIIREFFLSQWSDFLALPFSLLPHWPKRTFSPHARNCTQQIGQNDDPGMFKLPSGKNQGILFPWIAGNPGYIVRGGPEKTEWLSFPQYVKILQFNLDIRCPWW